MSCLLVQSPTGVQGRLKNAVLLKLVGDTYTVNISFHDAAMIVDRVSKDF